MKLGSSYGSRARTAKKCTKKRDERAELLFANQNLLLFSRSRCRRRRHCMSLLKLPISVIQKFWLRDDTLLLSIEEGKIDTLDTFTFQLLMYFSCRLHTLKEKRRRVTSMQ